mmetsp:Transcript_21622/g.41258  ORF Transcript_21622/g.41258 Transcript_21622/m.41258 type:complete len:323 (-) Transcript_21622:414-1382(-)|eukprot:CAMPEP_0114250042 /NCGR_PEP_ID=MMETSP0058-20121206/14483_1 /TAXON_ID=36894 /ORGANISM="Pyramimonas parkeae, CCMP726" /LENGTH=322 /DNA_ID=CAMNT_0001363665 /DNA_START=195 /DNA_END=1163 /DNA_ORIENTATION=-
MANKYGLFSEPTYNAVGDPYTGKEPVADRLKGLNFKATKCKKGVTHTKDMVFDPIKPLFEGEKYTKTREEKEAARAERAKTLASDKPFRPSNPAKKSTGLGGYDGVLGPKNPHLPEFDTSVLVKQKGQFEAGPRNIVTNPAKKGTFGMNKTTLGEKISVGGAVGEYSYQPSPYDEQRRLASEDAAHKAANKASDKPFKPPNPIKKGGFGTPGVTLGGKGPGIAGEYQYVDQGPQPRATITHLEKPFRPTGNAKLGYNCTFNKFPAYQEDPMEVKLQAERQARLEEHQRMASGAKFVPPNILKGGATPSVLHKNIVLNFKANC